MTKALCRFSSISWLPILLILAYMAMVVVILLNILIAQLSYTYAEAKKTAKLQYAVDRMFIVSRLETSRFARFVWQLSGLSCYYYFFLILLSGSSFCLSSPLTRSSPRLPFVSVHLRRQNHHCHRHQLLLISCFLFLSPPSFFLPSRSSPLLYFLLSPLFLLLYLPLSLLFLFLPPSLPPSLPPFLPFSLSLFHFSSSPSFTSIILYWPVSFFLLPSSLLPLILLIF